MKSIVEELSWRGLLKQVTNEEKILHAQNNNKGVYCGFDPTAESLHVGNLIQIILLDRFAQFGFKPIAVIGGTTGLIGDPSGKNSERVLLSSQTVENNFRRIKNQLSRLIPSATIIDNSDWLAKMSLVDYLREVGKDFNISYLLNKEQIASRVEEGLSYTEFSYTLLQAYDFYQLYKNNDCYAQIGGSDQWGNITSGIDYIRKQVGDNHNACGLTMHLLTKSDGRKFGKSESGAIWLDRNKTSPYEFYQFFINQEDSECEKLLKYFTFLTKQEIENLVKQHQEQPAQRICQKKLAEEVTRYVHGESGLQEALLISDALFNNKVHELPLAVLKSLETNLPLHEVNSNNTYVIDLLIEANIATSKRQAREFFAQNALSINGETLSNGEQQTIDRLDFLYDTYLVIKKGKKNYYLIKKGY